MSVLSVSCSSELRNTAMLRTDDSVKQSILESGHFPLVPPTPSHNLLERQVAEIECTVNCVLTCALVETVNMLEHATYDDLVEVIWRPMLQMDQCLPTYLTSCVISPQNNSPDFTLFTFIPRPSRNPDIMHQ